MFLRMEQNQTRKTFYIKRLTGVYQHRKNCCGFCTVILDTDISRRIKFPFVNKQSTGVLGYNCSKRSRKYQVEVKTSSNRRRW